MTDLLTSEYTADEIAIINWMVALPDAFRSSMESNVRRLPPESKVRYDAEKLLSRCIDVLNKFEHRGPN